MCHFDALLFLGVVWVLFPTARRLVLCFVLAWSVGRSVVIRCTWSAFWCAVLGLVVILSAPFSCLAPSCFLVASGGCCSCFPFAVAFGGGFGCCFLLFFFVFAPFCFVSWFCFVLACGCFFWFFYGLIFENKKRKKTLAGLFPWCCAVGHFHRFLNSFYFFNVNPDRVPVLVVFQRNSYVLF